MKEAFKRVFPIVLIHLAAGFLCALFISLRESAIPDLLPPFEFAFKMRNAVIRFAQVFPALIAGGLLTGYALMFCKLLPENAGHLAEVFPALKSAFAFAIILAGAYAILAECAVPILKSRQNDAMAKTASYNNYMLLYRTESASGNFRAALANAETALAIWKESPEAQNAADAARIRVSELYSGGFGFAEEGSASAVGAPARQGGYTAFELLEKAREAAALTDFYNAHYYAALSWRTAPAGDPNREAALRLASESWNRITGALDGIRAEPERRYYERKLKGYSDIQAGDFLSAYYHFLEMQEEEEAAGGERDPDIATFLEIARQGVLESFFFINETENLALFEQSGGIFFTLLNDDGSKDAVLIGGVSRRGTGAEGGAYFRNFELARFEKDNSLSFHIAVPYAKMLPFIDGNGNTRPQLILAAVDRAAGGARIEPQVVAGNFPPQDAAAASVLLLDMPYQDMALLIDSAAGADSMTLPSLLGFMRRGENYGFQKAVYLAEFVQRISDPFLVFIMAVLALVWAWKFQLRQNRPFSAWWIISVPLIAIACAYIIAAARYALNLCITLLAVKTPSLAIPCTAALIVLALFAVSAWFFSQRRVQGLAN